MVERIGACRKIAGILNRGAAISARVLPKLAGSQRALEGLEQKQFRPGEAYPDIGLQVGIQKIGKDVLIAGQNETFISGVNHGVLTKEGFGIVTCERIGDPFELSLSFVGASEPIIDAISLALLRIQDPILDEDPFPSPILICGETGTGKEVLARFLHSIGPRQESRLMATNLGEFTRDLVRSELFGHVRGSFTGAFTDRKGLFRSADNGSLLLDEIGEMPLDSQTSLLRVIERGEVMPVGRAEESEVVNVQLIATTNKDLMNEVNAKRFRQDLFYRLGIPIVLPPLRERKGDIPALANYFLRRINAGLVLSEESSSALCDYSWPGNVRELSQNIRRAASFASARGENVIELADLAIGIKNGATRSNTNYMTYEEMLQAHETEKRQLFRQALDGNNGNISHAAKALGMNRTTLLMMLKRSGLI